MGVIDLPMLTASTVTSLKTLWDRLPKMKSPSMTYMYRQKLDYPDSTEGKGAGLGAMETMMPPMSQFKSGSIDGAFTGEALIPPNFKTMLGDGYTNEKQSLIQEVKDQILLKAEKSLHTAYGTITTSGSYLDSGSDWTAGTSSIDNVIANAKVVGNTMHGNIGKWSNALAVNTKVFKNIGAGLVMKGILDNQMYLDALKSGDAASLIGAILGMEIWELDCTANSAGTYSSLWGDYAWFLYIDRNASATSASPTFGVVVETNANGGSGAWDTQEIEKTEADGSWKLMSWYYAKFQQTNLKACIRLARSGGAALVTS